MKVFVLLFICLLLTACSENYGGEAHRSSIYIDAKAPGRIYVKANADVQSVANDRGLYFFENGRLYLLFASANISGMDYKYWSDAELAKLLDNDPRLRGILNPKLPCFGVEWLKQNPKESNRSVDREAYPDNNELAYRKWMLDNHLQYCG